MNNFLLAIVFLISVLYVVLLFAGNEIYAEYFRSFIMPFLFAYYFLSKKNTKYKYYTLFLLTSSFSDIVFFSSLLLPDSDFIYFSINSLNILAYSFLLIYCVKNTNMNLLKTKYIFESLVLLLLAITGVIYFSSIIYTDDNIELVFEIAYNVVLMALLVQSALMYFTNSSEKTMLLFLGVLTLVLGELITTAFYSMNHNETLNIVYSVIYIASLYFLISHTFVKRTEDFKLL